MTPARTGAFILGCEGPVLSADEAAFFRAASPAGFILFTRNIVDTQQVVRLTSALRQAVGWDAPILIDQEGGRVDRLLPLGLEPWLPALDQCAAAGPRAADLMQARSRVIAHELRALGIDVNCVPVCDIARPDTHPVLRNRTYGTDAATVTDLARATARGTLAGGVLPVIKHMPGHGLGTKDSHLDLPRVDAALDRLEAEDFAPFRALSDLPLAMSAHVVYAALDPDLPGTISPVVQRYVRDTLGYPGLIMTDDLSMQALPGDIATRTRASIAAGIDIILHCNGKAAEAQAVAANAPALTHAQRAKLDAALALRAQSTPVDIAALRADLARVRPGV